jgi:hypothetical protein
VTQAQPAPTSQSPFAAALSGYSTWVDQVAVASDDAVTPALRHALEALADAIAAMPAAGDLDPVDVASALRSSAIALEKAPPMSSAESQIVRNALLRTEGILQLAAERPYRAAASVGDQVNALHKQTATIDPYQPLGEQLPRILGSLEAAERVLRSMARVNAG